jgi:hypothetical protein
MAQGNTQPNPDNGGSTKHRPDKLRKEATGKAQRRHLRKKGRG